MANYDQFNVMQYAAQLPVNVEEYLKHHVNETKILIENIQLLKDDPWACRSAFWGLASASENQVQYLQSSFVPNLERRINSLEGRGFLSETDVGTSWFSNEDHAHENDEVTIDDQIADTKRRLGEVIGRCEFEAIEHVLYRQAHDELSRDLEQMTYGEIKSAALQKRKANARRAA